ncbi:MAG: hypothetical protein OEZ45_08125 [Candidatus Aminicenantes bacterium]|nr:hypothetical protein [Candidatus Aminicenantes bacterium]
MKKLFSILSSFILLSSIAIAQEFIENPEKPLSKNAGRVLQLEEVFRITDESSDFYFNAPHSLVVDTHHNFYVIDENQILKFSADGKYLKNLFIKGQGPGEISTRYHWGLSYFLLKDEIILHDSDGNKIIHMDDEGNLIEEIKLKTTRFQKMYGPTDQGFIFMNESPANIGPTGFRDVDMSIILVSKDGSTSRTIMVFPKKVYSGKTFVMDWDKFFALFDSKTQQIFVSYTGEYKIVSADLSTGQIIRSFNRKYPRAKYVIPEGIKKFYEKSNIERPERKYENDILGLFFHKDHLWVKTSTKDEKKGVLIDVFSREGKYIDSFYFNLKGDLMAAQGDYIFVSEKDEDENIQIVKYKIIE